MGNCSCCFKPKTSDDVEEPSEGQQKSVRGQGQRSVRSSVRSVASTSKNEEPHDAFDQSDPVRSSSRSIDRTSKSRKSLTSFSIKDASRSSSRSTASVSKGQRSVVNVNQISATVVEESVLEPKEPEVILRADDLGRRSSLRASQKKSNTSVSVQNKENLTPGRPAGKPAVEDAYSDGGRRLMRSYGFIRRVTDICPILWLEDDHLEFNKHYKFSRNQGLQCHQLTESFFREHPTYGALRKLLRIYSEVSLWHQRGTAENEFLEAALKTKVMQICWAFLNQNNYFSYGRNDFKNILLAIWFPDAFKHIFVGDSDDNNERVSGLHNWMQYWMEFVEGNIAYRKCIKQVERMMVVLQYHWNGNLKDQGSMFIGTSPEFELALYTLLYFETLAHNHQEWIYDFWLEDRKASRAEQHIQVKIVVRCEDRTLRTAYPVKPVYD